MKKRMILLSLAFLFLFSSGHGQIQLSNTLHKRGHQVICSAYSPDSRYIATGGTDNRIVIWDAHSGAIVNELKTRGWPRALKFTHDSRYLVSGGKDNKVKIWDYKSGKIIHDMKGHRDQIIAIDISPDDKYIASGSADELIKLWDLDRGRILEDLKGHRGNVTSVMFHPTGAKLVSGSADKTVKEWNIPRGNEISSIKAHSSWVRAVAYSPDGNLIASAGDDKRIQIWKDGKEYNSLLAHRDWVQTVQFSNDSKYLLSGSHDRYFIIWEVESGKMVYSSEKQRDKIFAAEFSPDGKKILTSDFTYDISLWDVASLNIPSSAEKPILMAENKPEKKEIAEKKPEPEKKKQEIKEPEEKNETKKAVAGKVVTPPAKVSGNVIEVDMIQDLGIQPNPYRYALIIGNEDYSSFQLGLKTESNVDFARRDAETFKKYARYVLGVPEENIIFLTDARAIQMHRAINKINMIANITKGKSEIFFYYAGHGFPDEKTKEPYIMPVDVSGSDLEFALSLNEVYKKLTEHPTKRVTVFLDACFSGGARNQGLIAARGVKIQPKENIFKGNMVVFSASSGDQSSLPYKEKQHGMFTYHLLKKLQETKGNITYRELSEYLKENVAVKSIMVNNKEQIPETNVSVDIENTWGQLKITP